MYYDNTKPFDTLKGMTLVRVTGKTGDGEITFENDQGKKFKLYHAQDCCESVYVESIVGDLQDLVGHPILVAEEVDSTGVPPPKSEWPPESFTWTFYKLATIKGYVDIRFIGESNGYYSESVYFVEV